MRPMENARKLNLADAFALHTLCAPTKKKKTKLITILNCLQNFALNVANRQVGVLMSRERRRREGMGGTA